MTVRLDRGTILLEGSCPVEEAETLLELLLDNPACPVDASGARYFHAALLQVLLAVKPAILGLPDDAFHRRWIAPLVASNHMELESENGSNENDAAGRRG